MLQVIIQLRNGASSSPLEKLLLGLLTEGLPDPIKNLWDTAARELRWPYAFYSELLA